jgi:hypothetical protein
VGASQPDNSSRLDPSIQSPEHELIHNPIDCYDCVLKTGHLQLAVQQQHVAGCCTAYTELAALHVIRTTRALVIFFSSSDVAAHLLLCCFCALQYDSVDERLSQALRLADVAGTKARLASLQNDASSDSIWDDPDRAQGLLSEISSLKDELAEIDRYSWRCGV